MVKNLILFIVVFMALSPFAIAQGLENLVIYLPFDEGSGDIVKDRGPFKLEGKLVASPKWVDGKFGKALQFGGAGAGQYVEIAHQPNLDADTAVTVMSWMFPNTWPHKGACCDQVWGFGVHGGCGGRVQWGLFQEGDLKARFEAAGGRLDIPAPLPEEKKWTHVAITYDNGVGRLYIDGKMAAEGKGAGALNKSNEPLMIAADCERLNYAFDGIIDEFRMFHRALSEKEIGALMEKGSLAVVNVASKLAVAWGQIKSAK